MPTIKPTVKALLLLLFLLPFHQSCTDLEEEVYSDLTTANYPRTETDFVRLIGAVYTNLYPLLQHNGYFSMQEVSSDEICIPQRGNDWGSPQWLHAHRHNFNPNDEAINNAWNALYGGIFDCNRILELFGALIREGSVEAAQAAPYISEVKVLRALFYYWLLDGFGNVPIVTGYTEATPNPLTVPRADVFAFVEQELNENVPNLSRAKDVSTYARLNYWTGRALQAKLYLNAEVYTGTPRYADVLAACEEIINSGLYSLESDYFTNFNTDNSGSNENIFVIPYDRAHAPGFNVAQMTLHYASQATFELQQQPWNGYCTLQEFYESYTDDDLRKGEYGNQQVRGNFLAGPQYAADGVTPILDPSFDDPDGPELVYTPELNELSPQCYSQAGARIGKFEFELGATPDLNNDFPIFRYADVLLMKAEALLRRNESPEEALLAVNDIRARADADEYGPADLTLDNLLAERGRELFYEGWRRQDLIRFGTFGDPWWEKLASEPCKELFPIPRVQLQAGSNLVQNPCY